jgi:hypothetical protein
MHIRNVNSNPLLAARRGLTQIGTDGIIVPVLKM